MQYKYLDKRIKHIIFMPCFGDEDTSKKIGDIVQISPFDEYHIKRSIKKLFGLKLDCKISGMTTDEICKQVYEFVRCSESKKITQKEISAEKNLLNSHEVFAITLGVFNSLLGRRIFPTEPICKLKTEIETKAGKGVDKVLSELLYLSFGVPINITSDTKLKPEMTVYNIVNQVTYALVKYGKAIDPKVECAGMSPLWVPIRTSMTFNTLVNILREKFGIRPSIKTISNVKSYEDLDGYVIKLLVKNKINEIVFDNSEINLCHGISETLIDTNKAKSIKQNVQNTFGITVDYDISGTKLSRLYWYVYEKANHSEELRNILFGKQKTIENIVNKNKGPHENKPRHEIFRDIIYEINHAVSLERSVQSYTKVSNLLSKIHDNQEKVINLEKTFENLENEHKIKIDMTDPYLKVGDICCAVHDSMVMRGKSEATYIALEDMEPLWAALNHAIKFEHLRSVLKNEIGVGVSVYKLSNCRTYDDYVKLVNIALAKKTKSNNR